MSRLSIVLVLAALALPAAALAKGPSEGTISGPGFTKTVNVLNDGGGGSPGGNLTQAAGFFPAVFQQSPDPMLHAKPAGKLGPRYTVVWTVPGGEGTVFHIRQELYPYAQGGAVSYTKPDQRIFGMGAVGGWYRDTGLKRTLVALGLPTQAPSSSDGANWTLVGGLAAAAAVAVGALLLWLRQRSERSPAGKAPTPVSGTVPRM